MENNRTNKDIILAVTGITGHSGLLFLQELEKQGFNSTVRCLVRSSSNTDVLDKSPLNIEKLVGDYNQPEVLKQLTLDADVVMHISTIYQSVDMLKACIDNNVPKLVMVHTTGVYSKHKMASSEYQAIENKIESILTSQKQKNENERIDVTILRPTMIFGDMKDRNIHKFIGMVDRFPIMPEIDHGRGRIRPVNARDLAKAYYKVCMADHLPNLYYDLSGERSLSLHELFELCGEGVGKRVRYINCPMWLGSIGARVIKCISFGKIDYVEKVLRMGENRDYDHDSATTDFGYEPEKFNEGLQREIKQYLSVKRIKGE